MVSPLLASIAELIMRTHKEYTNATFTRRVDHDGGPHRTARAPREPIVCAGCGAVYARRRWSLAPSAQVRAAGKAGAPIDVRICPACHRRNSGLPHGFVHADGGFLHAHRDDIEHLLRNEAARAAEDNPTGQIIDLSDDGTGGIVVTTSTEHLAIRLGRALEKAYDGCLLYGFSHENKLAHVWWHRDDAAPDQRT